MVETRGQVKEGGPLERLDDWDDFVVERYPEGEVGGQAHRKGSGEAFRDYRAEARPGVKEFYRLNHARQTLEFVKEKKEEYLDLDHKLMGVWEAIELLDTLVDDSDPDTELSQLEHLLQAAEAGATAVIQPGGSIRDDEVIEAANEAGLAMVFTGMRHFRH